MVWCQAPLASGARKEREKKKKSISDNMRDRKLAAAQIRLPTFDKRKWANLVYPSKRLQSNTFLLWLSKTHERGRARARGEALQPRSGSVQEEGGCTGCSFYSEERLAVLFFRPAPLLTPPPPLFKVSTIMSQGRVALGRGSEVSPSTTLMANPSCLTFHI